MRAFAEAKVRGSADKTLIGLIGMVAALCVLGWMLSGIDRPESRNKKQLRLYCAAGTRPAIDAIIRQYQADFDVFVDVQYQGSNTLLSQIEIAKTGDVYLAADDDYIRMAKERGLVKEDLPIARQRPVIAVRKDNPKGIERFDDLLRADVRTAMGNPGQAAIGRVTKSQLQRSGRWDEFADRVHEGTLVFKPTVPEVANDVKIGSVDAGITWDATLNNYPELKAIRIPELDGGTANISVGVLTCAANPADALHFVRYLAAPEKGQKILAAKGFETTPGDPWADVPELTFFCGAVNSRAVEPVIEAFRKRENAVINVSYDGCGILTGKMRTIDGQDTTRGFPDTFLACDQYYLNEVGDWFDAGQALSETRLVIVVPAGNPRNIRTLRDLTNKDLRVAIGQPQQCTAGVLAKRLLDSEGLVDSVVPVSQKTSSALLIPDVATGMVDAAIAYHTDTLAEPRVEAIPIDSPLAMAVQPFSIARTTRNRQLAERFFRALIASRASFEDAGFHWRFEEAGN